MSNSSENSKKGFVEEVNKAMKNQKDDKGVGTSSGESKVGRTTKTRMNKSNGTLKKEVIDISNDEWDED